MLHWFKRRTETLRTAEKIYGGVVTAARRPEFYGRLGVKDTPEGRFELVALHLFMVLDAVKGHGPLAETITQRTIEAFVTDMDDCMREMGVGDLTVPKKVKRAAAAFYERSGRYRDDLKSASDVALAKSLDTYIFKGNAETGAVGTLTAYVRNTVNRLAATPLDELVDEVTLGKVMDQSWMALT